MQLDRVDVAAGAARRGDHAGTKHIAISRRQRERLRHLDNQVGFAELPARRERRRLRQSGGIALDGTATDPAKDRFHFLVAEATLAEERSVARLRQPGRHVTILDDDGDVLGMAADVVVGQQAERRGAVGPVAGGALLPDNRRHVARERRCPRRRGLARRHPVVRAAGTVRRSGAGATTRDQESVRDDGNARHDDRISLRASVNHHAIVSDGVRWRTVPY